MPEIFRQSEENPLVHQEGPKSKQSSLKQIFLLFTLSIMTACNFAADVEVESSNSKDSNHLSEDDTEDSGRINVSRDTGEEQNSEDTSGNDTADTAAPYDPESIPDVIGTWPTADTNGVSQEIANALRETYSSLEPSGITYSQNENLFYIVGDDGDLVQLRKDGSIGKYWIPGGNLEAVTINPSTNLVYLAEESTTSVLEFNPATDAMTGLNCILDLSTDIANNLGVEGLEFVPAEYAPETWVSDSTGYFIAGSQYVSDLSVYSVEDCHDGAVIEAIDTVSTSNTDIAGIAFNEETRRLYVLHDYANTVDLIKLDGTLVATYILPTIGQEEGIRTSVTDCEKNIGELIIADDNAETITIYPDFPMTCR